VHSSARANKVQLRTFIDIR